MPNYTGVRWRSRCQLCAVYMLKCKHTLWKNWSVKWNISPKDPLFHDAPISSHSSSMYSLGIVRKVAGLAICPMMPYQQETMKVILTTWKSIGSWNARTYCKSLLLPDDIWRANKKKRVRQPWNFDIVGERESWDVMDSCVAFYISVVGPIGPCNLVWYPPPVQGVLEVSDERLSAISRVKLEWRQMMALAWSPLALISPAWWIGENSLSLSLSAYSIFTYLIVFTILHDVNLNCTLARKSAR